MKKQRIDIRQSRNAKSGLKELCKYIISQITPVRMVEVGSFAGNSTEIFLQYIPYVICVDPWESNFDDNDIISNPSQYNMEEVYQQFKKYIIDKHKWNVLTLKCTSMAAVTTIENESIDFAYIDGNHQARFVREDIQLWMPKVRKGGFLGGHDYNSKRYPHIKDIVDSQFPNIQTFKDSSWITTKQ